MRRSRQIRVTAFVLLYLLTPSPPAEAGERVRVENASHATQCAEEDNVYVKLIGAGIARFAIEARHPAYLAALAKDSMAADFSKCDQSRDKSYPFEPKDVTLYEDRNYRLVGHTFDRFWRSESVDFRVGDTVTHGLQLVQLIRKIAGHPIEILVVYPADGYWRLKPLPPPRFADTGYGSSFLIGPIAEDGRPFVPIISIEFTPADLAFHLRFKQGAGIVRVAVASRERTRLEVTLTPPSGLSPFAALRSMFVSPEKADTTEAILDGKEPQPIQGFDSAEAQTVAFARSVPSRHNASAPDLIFSDFGR